MAELVGAEIAGYRIQSLIARGGMGEVYLATQAFPERKVALKLLPHNVASDPAFRERFIRESNAAAALEHPNILPVYGAGQADDELYIAMRYVDGEDLRSLLDRGGPLPPERAVSICSQVADALEEAHEHGLVHRDVKPGNILLGKGDRAYLTDFGLIQRTKLETDLTKTGQFMGTVDYVAPEQIKGEEIDGRADVYSLGCVLYECVTGEPPFQRDSAVGTIYAHLEESVPAPSSKRSTVPPRLDQVVAKATANRPEDRFTSARELAETLREGLTAGRSPRRRSALAALVGATILGIVLVAVMSIGDSSTNPQEPPGGASRPSPSAGTAFPPGTLVQLDAETGSILSTTPGVPTSNDILPQVEVGEGSVWVLAATNIAQVNPADGSIERVITLGQGGSAPVVSLAVGLRTVWVGSFPGVVRINPAIGQELRPVPLKDAVSQTIYVDLGGSSVWAATGSDLFQIDPVTARRIGSADTDLSVSGLGVGFEAVWAIDYLQGTLTRFDTSTLKVDGVYEAPGNANAIAVGEGDVWLLDSDVGSVTPFHPAAESFGSSIRVGVDPTDLAVGLGSVWVTNQGDGTISRIDPLTGAVQTLAVGGPVAAIAVDEPTSTLWVVFESA